MTTKPITDLVHWKSAGKPVCTNWPPPGPTHGWQRLVANGTRLTCPLCRVHAARADALFQGNEPRAAHLLQKAWGMLTHHLVASTGQRAVCGSRRNNTRWPESLSAYLDGVNCPGCLKKTRRTK